MELLLLVLALIGLGILAIRFGHDSRDALTSAEHTQAALGATWDGKPTGCARGCAATSQYNLRHHAAVTLYCVADWLQHDALHQSPVNSRR